jgi:hypothetical protein
MLPRRHDRSSFRKTKRGAVCYRILMADNSHRSMLSYLYSSGMKETFDSLKRETGINDFNGDDTPAKWVGLLEKKWTSVIRLQKKVTISNRAE